MSGEQAHDRQSFEAQGSAFLKQNISDKPEFDYAENRPPHSTRLAGKTLTLSLRDAPERWRHVFGEQEVEVEILPHPRAEGLGSGAVAPRSFTTPYEAFEMAADVFFVSYLASETASVAMALDITTGVATMVLGEMKSDGIVSTVEAALVEEAGREATGQAAGAAVVGPAAGTPAFHPPFSLGGTRFLNTYAHNVAYEHIYLTGVYETWLGVKGPQAGQADTEEYHAFKIADGVYLLYWNEGVLTAQMTFLFNFFRGDCVAELFARVDGEMVHNTIGATTRIIHTKLPELPDAPRIDVFSGD